MSNKVLSYIIPAYNEEKTIHLILDKVKDVQLINNIEKQIITQGSSFGSTITYINDLFVISEPTGSPNVYIYQLITTTLLNTLLLYQTIAAPGGVTNWGTSTAMSGDQNWLYISDTSNALVYVYRRSAITEQYVNYGTLSVAGLTSADGFGYSISTDYYGDTIVIGAPQQDYDGNTQNYGYTYVFSRTVENFEASSSSRAYIPVIFNLSWTPSNPSNLSTMFKAQEGHWFGSENWGKEG
jgi:hypothetical protein